MFPEDYLGEVNFISVVEDERTGHSVPLRVITSPSSASANVSGNPEPSIIAGDPPTEGI